MITISEYQKKQKEKIIGYLLRFGSIVIWGLQPLLFKYTPISEVDLSTKVLFEIFGTMFASLIAIIFLYYFGEKTSWHPKIVVNKFLYIIIFTSLLLVYLPYLSLDYTSGSNFILLNNFSPIFALLIAFIFWRDNYAYFNDKKNIIFIFLIFLLGGIGGSFLFYNDLLIKNIGTFTGNLFALAYMIFDVLFSIALIRYSSSLKNYQSYL